MIATLTGNYSVGGLLIGRTIAVLLTMTLSTSLAARKGSVLASVADNFSSE